MALSNKAQIRNLKSSIKTWEKFLDQAKKDKDSSLIATFKKRIKDAEARIKSLSGGGETSEEKKDRQKSEETRKGSTDRATAEAMKEMVDDGILPEEILEDDDLFDFVSEKLAPFYDRQESRIKKKYKLNDRKNRRDVRDELREIAKNKKLYEERYQMTVDRALELEARITGRTKEDLAEDLHRLGILGDRERRNIREGYNASGRFKSSERVMAEAESLEDQRFAESELEEGAERTIQDIDIKTDQAIEDADLLRRGQISQLEFDRRQAERDADYREDIADINEEEDLDALQADKVSGIQSAIQDVRETEFQSQGFQEQELVSAEQGLGEAAIEDEFNRV